MLDPFRMVFVNILGCGLVGIGTLFYIFIYPKKKPNLFLLLSIILALPLTSLLRAGDYESGDFNIHIYRIMSFYDSLSEGNIMPSWAGELNATYGNPLFIFNYSLPYYFVSLFKFIGFSFIAGMKIYLGLNLYLSGIFMYFLVRKLTQKNLPALTSAVFYVFNPYHLIDVHFRATLGETTIFTLVPLLFLSLIEFNKKNTIFSFSATSLLMGAIFLAHPLVGSVIFCLSVLYTGYYFFKKQRIKKLTLSILPLVTGALASSYVWVSFFIFSQYTFPNPGLTLKISPESFYGLFYAPWRYGLLFQGPKGELALFLGYSQILVTAVSFYLLLKVEIKKTIKKSLIFWLFLFFIFIFLISPAASGFWKPFPILWMLLPSGRLLVILAFITSLIAGYFTWHFSSSKRGEYFLYILIALTIGSTILNWGHRRVIPEITDTELRNNVWISTVNEGVTAYFLNNKWADIENFWFSELPPKHLEIERGDAKIIELRRTSTEHRYIVDAKTPSLIKENTLFFPGWSLSSNNKRIHIFPGYRGVIHANIPKGIQYLEIQYKDIPPYRIFKMISVIIFITLLSAMLISITKGWVKKLL